MKTQKTQNYPTRTNNNTRLENFKMELEKRLQSRYTQNTKKKLMYKVKYQEDLQEYLENPEFKHKRWWLKLQMLPSYFADKDILEIENESQAKGVFAWQSKMDSIHFIPNWSRFDSEELDFYVNTLRNTNTEKELHTQLLLLNAALDENKIEKLLIDVKDLSYRSDLEFMSNAVQLSKDFRSELQELETACRSIRHSIFNLGGYASKNVWQGSGKIEAYFLDKSEFTQDLQNDLDFYTKGNQSSSDVRVQDILNLMKTINNKILRLNRCVKAFNWQFRKLNVEYMLTVLKKITVSFYRSYTHHFFDKIKLKIPTINYITNQVVKDKNFDAKKLENTLNSVLELEDSACIFYNAADEFVYKKENRDSSDWLKSIDVSKLDGAAFYAKIAQLYFEVNRFNGRSYGISFKYKHNPADENIRLLNLANTSKFRKNPKLGNIYIENSSLINKKIHAANKAILRINRIIDAKNSTYFSRNMLRLFYNICESLKVILFFYMFYYGFTVQNGYEVITGVFLFFGLLFGCFFLRDSAFETLDNHVGNYTGYGRGFGSEAGDIDEDEAEQTAVAKKFFKNAWMDLITMVDPIVDFMNTEKFKRARDMYFYHTAEYSRFSSQLNHQGSSYIATLMIFHIPFLKEFWAINYKYQNIDSYNWNCLSEIAEVRPRKTKNRHTLTTFPEVHFKRILTELPAKPSKYWSVDARLDPLNVKDIKVELHPKKGEWQREHPKLSENYVIIKQMVLGRTATVITPKTVLAWEALYVFATFTIFSATVAAACEVLGTLNNIFNSFSAAAQMVYYEHIAYEEELEEGFHYEYELWSSPEEEDDIFEFTSGLQDAYTMNHRDRARAWGNLGFYKDPSKHDSEEELVKHRGVLPKVYAHQQFSFLHGWLTDFKINSSGYERKHAIRYDAFITVKKKSKAIQYLSSMIPRKAYYIFNEEFEHRDFENLLQEYDKFWKFIKEPFFEYVGDYYNNDDFFEWVALTSLSFIRRILYIFTGHIIPIPAGDGELINEMKESYPEIIGREKLLEIEEFKEEQSMYLLLEAKRDAKDFNKQKYAKIQDRMRVGVTISNRFKINPKDYFVAREFEPTSEPYSEEQLWAKYKYYNDKIIAAGGDDELSKLKQRWVAQNRVFKEMQFRDDKFDRLRIKRNVLKTASVIAEAHARDRKAGVHKKEDLAAADKLPVSSRSFLRKEYLGHVQKYHKKYVNDDRIKVERMDMYEKQLYIERNAYSLEAMLKNHQREWKPGLLDQPFFRRFVPDSFRTMINPKPKMSLKAAQELRLARERAELKPLQQYLPPKRQIPYKTATEAAEEKARIIREEGLEPNIKTPFEEVYPVRVKTQAACVEEVEHKTKANKYSERPTNRKHKRAYARYRSKFGGTDDFWVI